MAQFPFGQSIDFNSQCPSIVFPTFDCEELPPQFQVFRSARGKEHITEDESEGRIVWTALFRGEVIRSTMCIGLPAAEKKSSSKILALILPRSENRPWCEALDQCDSSARSFPSKCHSRNGIGI